MSWCVNWEQKCLSQEYSEEWERAHTEHSVLRPFLTEHGEHGEAIAFVVPLIYTFIG